MWIELDELIELAKGTDTTDAKTVNIIIAAQDYALQRQREKAKRSRMKAEWAVLELECPRTGWSDF
jgi:hypothetical protein